MDYHPTAHGCLYGSVKGVVLIPHHPLCLVCKLVTTELHRECLFAVEKTVLLFTNKSSFYI